MKGSRNFVMSCARNGIFFCLNHVTIRINIFQSWFEQISLDDASKLKGFNPWCTALVLQIRSVSFYERGDKNKDQVRDNVLGTLSCMGGRHAACSRFIMAKELNVAQV